MAAAPAKQRNTGSSLEDSDDVLLIVFAQFSLEERLRLIRVSKRWQRLLQAELRFPRWLLWRAPAIVRRAGAALRVLDITPTAGDVVRQALPRLVQALSCGAGAELRTLVLWDLDPADGECQADPLGHLALLSPEQALEVRASCPRLECSTRLAVLAAGAAQAVELLDALPGCHAVQLTAPTAADASAAPAAELAALGALMRHSRLRGLHLCLKDPAPPLAHGVWFDAALAAVTAALSPPGQLQGCSLQHLSVFDNRNEHLAEPGSAFLERSPPVVASFGPPGQPPPECCLRSFTMQTTSQPDFTRGVLVASRGSLSCLYVESSSCLVPWGADEAMAELLERIGSRLESLTLGKDIISESLLPGLAPLLSSPACRLRRLALGSYMEINYLAAEPVEAWATVRPYHRFIHALAANRSLKDLHMVHSTLSPEGASLLGAALAARIVPLERLNISGARDLGAAGAH